MVAFSSILSTGLIVAAVNALPTSYQQRVARDLDNGPTTRSLVDCKEALHGEACEPLVPRAVESLPSDVEKRNFKRADEDSLERRDDEDSLERRDEDDSVERRSEDEHNEKRAAKGAVKAKGDKVEDEKEKKKKAADKVEDEKEKKKKGKGKGKKKGRKGKGKKKNNKGKGKKNNKGKGKKKNVKAKGEKPQGPKRRDTEAIDEPTPARRETTLADLD